MLASWWKAWTISVALLTRDTDDACHYHNDRQGRCLSVSQWQARTMPVSITMTGTDDACRYHNDRHGRCLSVSQWGLRTICVSAVMRGTDCLLNETYRVRSWFWEGAVGVFFLLVSSTNTFFLAGLNLFIFWCTSICLACALELCHFLHGLLELFNYWLTGSRHLHHLTHDVVDVRSLYYVGQNLFSV